MKKAIKISLFMAVMAMLCMWLAVSVCAVTEYTEGYYSYTITNEEATIIRVNDSICGDVVIPSTFGKYPVTTIGNYAFSGCNNFTDVTIPDTITSIGFGAFENTAYYNNKSNWEGSLLYLDDCLIGAAKVKEVIIKNGTRIIQNGLFDYNGIERLEIPDSAKSGGIRFDWNRTLKTISVGSGVERIEFYNCDALENVTLANGVKKIWFSGCNSLKNIVVPGSVKEIREGTFTDCNALRNVVFEDGVTTISDYAFKNDFWLVTSLTIPSSVTSVNVRKLKLSSNCVVFCYRNSAAHNSTPKNECVLIDGTDTESIISGKVGTAQWSLDKRTGVLQIKGSGNMISFENVVPPWSEYQKFVSSIYVSGDLKNIGQAAFKDMARLNSVTVSGNIQSIDKDAFKGSVQLKELKINNSVVSIGDSAFEKCYRLAKVTIPVSVRSIGRNAFSECVDLTEIILPSGVTSIDYGAFEGCKSLLKITIPKKLTVISENMFCGCESLKSVTITGKIKSIENGAFSGCTGLESITIPYSVTSICGYAFNNCTNLKSITIPYSVTSIQYNTFSGCSNLKSITIGTSVTSIGNAAFSECTSLENITIPNSCETIWKNAFYGCKNLKSLTVYNKNCSFDNNCGLNYQHTIYGYKGSTAETFAEQIGAQFIDIETIHTHEYKSINAGDNCKVQKCVCGKEKIIPHSYKSSVSKQPTCSSSGIKTFTCSCGDKYTETLTKKSHTYKTTTTKATLKKNGKTEKKCSVCGYVSKNIIYYPKTVKLSDTTFTYNKKTKTPTVTVKDSKGKALKKNTDYTVKYSKGRKSIGKYTVTVTFKGKYSGTKKLTFEIVPAKVKLSKVTAGSKQITAYWKTVSGATGYEVVYSTSKKFTKKTTKTVKIKKAKTVKTTIKKLKKGKKYYVKVRAYKTVSKKPVYGAYSSAKSVKVK